MLKKRHKDIECVILWLYTTKKRLEIVLRYRMRDCVDEIQQQNVMQSWKMLNEKIGVKETL